MAEKCHSVHCLKGGQFTEWLKILEINQQHCCSLDKVTQTTSFIT